MPPTPTLRPVPALVAGLVAVVALGTGGCNGSSAKPTLAEPSADPSTAEVTVGETAYRVPVTCFDAGAGSVAALGEGRDPASGKAVQLYVQAFFQEPYLVLAVGDQLIEPTPDEPLDLRLEEGLITGRDIRFVTDLDLVTLASRALGSGTVTVRCRSYVGGLPSSFGAASPRRRLGTTTTTGAPQQGAGASTSGTLPAR